MSWSTTDTITNAISNTIITIINTTITAIINTAINPTVLYRRVHECLRGRVTLGIKRRRGCNMRGIRGPTGCRETRRMMAAAMSEGGHRRGGGEMVMELRLLLLLLLLLLLTGICVSMAIMPMPSADAQP